MKYLPEILIGMAAAVALLAADSLPTKASTEEEILQVVQRIDERLDVVPVMQQTNNVNIPPDIVSRAVHDRVQYRLSMRP